MDAKADYSGNVGRVKKNAADDSVLAEKLAGGIRRAKRYRECWEAVDINEIVDRLAPGSKGVVKDGKITYSSEDKTFKIVVDVSGGYLRASKLEPKTGKYYYVDKYGNDAFNYVDERGVWHGKSRSEFKRTTHYRVKKREEMK